jgi:Skp family chaperone for outer membrane proteins
MKLTRLWVTAVLLLGAQYARASVTVAVVDVPTVSEKYIKTADLEDQFNVQRQEFNQERERRKEEMDKLARALKEQFKPGTADYQARQRQLVVLEAELKIFDEQEGTRLEQQFTESLKAIFDDIRAMVGLIAEERSFDLVLVADQLPTEDIPNPSIMRQQIAMQRVLYYSPHLDITNEVIARLNADYRKRLRPETADSATSPQDAPPTGSEQP